MVLSRKARSRKKPATHHTQGAHGKPKHHAKHHKKHHGKHKHHKRRHRKRHLTLHKGAPGGPLAPVATPPPPSNTPPPAFEEPTTLQHMNRLMWRGGVGGGAGAGRGGVGG